MLKFFSCLSVMEIVTFPSSLEKKRKYNKQIGKLFQSNETQESEVFSVFHQYSPYQVQESNLVASRTDCADSAEQWFNRGLLIFCLAVYYFVLFCQFYHSTETGKPFRCCCAWIFVNETNRTRSEILLNVILTLYHNFPGWGDEEKAGLAWGTLVRNRRTLAFSWPRKGWAVALLSNWLTSTLRSCEPLCLLAIRGTKGWTGREQCSNTLWTPEWMSSPRWISLRISGHIWYSLQTPPSCFDVI